MRNFFFQMQINQVSVPWIRYVIWMIVTCDTLPLPVKIHSPPKTCKAINPSFLVFGENFCWCFETCKELWFWTLIAGFDCLCKSQMLLDNISRVETPFTNSKDELGKGIWQGKVPVIFGQNLTRCVVGKTHRKLHKKWLK